MGPNHNLEGHQMVGPIRNLVQQQPTRSELRNPIFSALNYKVIKKLIMDTHHPDGTDVDVKPLLNTIEDMLPLAAIKGPHTNGYKQNRKPHQSNSLVLLDSLSNVTDKLASEMGLTDRDGHTTAGAIFHKVGNFHWDAKLVLTLAAFALNYRELWLLAQIFSSDQLAKSTNPVITEHTDTLKPWLDALNKLVHSILELTWCIVQFKELPSVYVTPDMPVGNGVQDH